MIHPARIVWVKDSSGLEVPQSAEFGDIYFSRENGLAETQHVFIQGNQLQTRLERLPAGQTFNVGETGFGTGLNLLTLWQLWENIQKNTPNANNWLHFISFEKYPLTKADLEKALSSWPELQRQAHELLKQYPPLLEGVHRLRFPESRLSVDIWWGDIHDMLPKVAIGFNQEKQTRRTGIDAWFLDGFAPACNEQMWQQQIFSQIKRLSHSGTTLSSFTVAGPVKRALLAEGAIIKKEKGFGKKREMLTAYFPSIVFAKNTAFKPFLLSQSPFLWPISPTYQKKRTSRQVAVIGAGVAGLSTAYSLAIRGLQVDLYEQQQPLAEGSGNPTALVSFKPVALKNVADHLHLKGCLSTLRWWQHPAITQQGGVLHFNTQKQKVSKQHTENYPIDVLQAFSNFKEINSLKNSILFEITNEGVWLVNCGLLRPHMMAAHILQHPNICLIQKKVTAIHDQSGAEVIVIAGDVQKSYQALVICNARAANDLMPELPKLNTIRGQISWLNHQQCESFQALLPMVPLSYGGYLVPPVRTPTFSSPFIIGASFVRQSVDTAIYNKEHEHNQQLLKEILPQLANILPPTQEWHGRAAIRAQTADYLPLAGRVHQNIYVLAGLGSKGFSFAPLCAEMIASQITGSPLPVSQTLLNRLNPLRTISANKKEK